MYSTDSSNCIPNSFEDIIFNSNVVPDLPVPQSAVKNSCVVTSENEPKFDHDLDLKLKL